METVLVTGGTGFIGLHCLQQLLDQGSKLERRSGANLEDLKLLIR